jgi:hypothetical protein
VYGPALISAFEEISNYSQEQIDMLQALSQESHRIMSRPSVFEGVKHMLKVGKGTVRRLSALADYEGKTRVICIGDWLSQSLLKPIHDLLMDLLRSNKSDFVHKQDMIPVRVKEYTAAGKPA